MLSALLKTLLISVGAFNFSDAVSAEKQHLAVQNTLKEFSTDGCSMYPNKTSDTNWVHCCIAHDVKYWFGGSLSEKKKSDIELGRCVAELTTQVHGKALQVAVSVGGHPTRGRLPWEWGYGWDVSNGFAKVTYMQVENILPKLKSVMSIVDALPVSLVDSGLTQIQRKYIKKMVNESQRFLLNSRLKQIHNPLSLRAGSK